MSKINDLPLDPKTVALRQHEVKGFKEYIIADFNSQLKITKERRELYNQMLSAYSRDSLNNIEAQLKIGLDLLNSSDELTGRQAYQVIELWKLVRQPLIFKNFKSLAATSRLVNLALEEKKSQEPLAPLVAQEMASRKKAAETFYQRLLNPLELKNIPELEIFAPTEKPKHVETATLRHDPSQDNWTVIRTAMLNASCGLIKISMLIPNEEVIFKLVQRFLEGCGADCTDVEVKLNFSLTQHCMFQVVEEDHKKQFGEVKKATLYRAVANSDVVGDICRSQLSSFDGNSSFPSLGQDNLLGGGPHFRKNAGDVLQYAPKQLRVNGLQTVAITEVLVGDSYVCHSPRLPAVTSEELKSLKSAYQLITLGWKFPRWLLTKDVSNLVFDYLGGTFPTSPQAEVLYLIFNFNRGIFTAHSQLKPAPQDLNCLESKSLKKLLKKYEGSDVFNTGSITITDNKLVGEIISSYAHLLSEKNYPIDVESDLPKPTYQSVTFSWELPYWLATTAVADLIFDYVGRVQEASDWNGLYLIYNINQELFTVRSQKLATPKVLDGQQSKQLQDLLIENKVTDLNTASLTITEADQVNKITAICRCTHLPLYPTPRNPKTGLPFASHANRDGSIITSNHRQGGSFALLFLTGRFTSGSTLTPPESNSKQGSFTPGSARFS